MTNEQLHLKIEEILTDYSDHLANIAVAIMTHKPLEDLLGHDSVERLEALTKEFAYSQINSIATTLGSDEHKEKTALLKLLRDDK